ncbi:MAG: pyridoxal phosphate-dependent aminotransferase [Candidatus Eremiobacteraeota bacterium]|nr:pyridoxal phosphate-dependent aminotransferase [Candidatus Eremiobacteraeota bacterium]
MNPRVTAISPSLIREVSSKKKSSSIDLGLGEPSLLPNRAHFEEAMRYATQHGVKYTPNAGDHALRAAIARHYGYPAMERAENVCVTVGSQEAMYVALKTLLDPSRDELLIVEPAFPSYRKMAALEGITARGVVMREDADFGFEAESIAAAVGPHTKAIVICSPCNPTARVLSTGEGEKLARALERRGGEPVWLIHDEIYREQIFTGDAAELARIYPHTIVTNSLSKSNALTGLRLGWILAPHDFVTQAIKVHAWLASCADTFAQRVALHVFETPGALQEHAPWYREQRVGLIDALERTGLRYIAPEGTFYACIRLSSGVPSYDAAHELIERYDVVAIPGIAFGEAMEGWLRLSWVSSPDRIATGLERIAEYCFRNSSSSAATIER